MLFHHDVVSTRTLTWQSSLHAMRDVRLGRTPFTTRGGYGGLPFRAIRELNDVTFAVTEVNGDVGLIRGSDRRDEAQRCEGEAEGGLSQWSSTS